MDDTTADAGIATPAPEWAAAIRQARDETGYRGPDVPPTVGGIRARLRGERHDEFDAELADVPDGALFEAFLYHWWTQALADNADGEEARQAAIVFADLATALHAEATQGARLNQPC
ncbi:hypothetical protein ABZ502_29380 [Streptomyces abikoensis]|uniref:hypothetical protein n=1 Tax=Streptomyces abikoensis TaxID=97398 RepID=UPI0033F6934B